MDMYTACKLENKSNCKAMATKKIQLSIFKISCQAFTKLFLVNKRNSRG